jgi:enoyl-CoA hydratase
MGEVRIEPGGDRVLLATIDNPPHGLMDNEVVDGLERLVERAESDPGVTGVVLTGAHPERFVAHYDVAELLAASRASPSVGRATARASLTAVGALRRLPGGSEALARTPAAGLDAAERFGEVLLRFNRAGAAFVAAINGSAMGGGCELALACDVRLMVAGPYQIGQPEILFGFPPGGGTQRLARLLGSARALRLCLEGAPLEPLDAQELGLIDEVVGREQLVDRARTVAERLARRPKGGIAGVKRAVYLGGSQSLPAGLREERAEFLAAIVSEDSDRAMAAYIEGLERTGELPGYDRVALERALDQGRFA